MRTRNGRRRILIGAAALAVAGVSGTSIATAAELQISEFPVAPASAPSSIIAGPDGNLWFTQLFRPGLVRLTPQGVVTEFTDGITPMPPMSMGGLLDVTAGPDGNVWFTGGERNLVGRVTPAGVVTEFSSGITAGSFTAGITTGPDGNLWFTENRANRLGRITPAGVVTEFPVGPNPQYAPSSGLGDITAGGDGNVWFVAPDGIGRMTPAGVATVFPVTGGTDDVTRGPDGNVWFRVGGAPSGLGAGVGRITPSGAVAVFPVPPTLAGGQGLTSGPDGNLWVLGQAAVGRVSTSGAVTVFTAGIRALSGLRDITAGPDGNLWFTMQYDNRIGRFAPPAADPPPVPPPVPPPPVITATLTAGISRPPTVRRGLRIALTYRVRNPSGVAASRVVVVARLPAGVVLDRRSRLLNRRVPRRALRFSASGRTVTFRPGTLPAGGALALRVNAGVSPVARPGVRILTVTARADGVPPVTATARMRIRR